MTPETIHKHFLGVLHAQFSGFLGLAKKFNVEAQVARYIEEAYVGLRDAAQVASVQELQRPEGNIDPDNLLLIKGNDLFYRVCIVSDTSRTDEFVSMLAVDIGQLPGQTAKAILSVVPSGARITPVRLLVFVVGAGGVAAMRPVMLIAARSDEGNLATIPYVMQWGVRLPDGRTPHIGATPVDSEMESHLDRLLHVVLEKDSADLFDSVTRGDSQGSIH